MKGRIVIELHEDEDDFGITVDVSAGLSTIEAIGLMDIAKAQHLASKHTQGPTVHHLQEPWAQSAN